MDKIPFLFSLLMLTIKSGGSAPSSCPAAIVQQWDNLTTWDRNTFRLTLSLHNFTGKEEYCSFDGEEEVEVFAFEQLQDSFNCHNLRDGGGVRKFFSDHDDPPKYVLSKKKTNIIFEFISGNFVFRIQGKHCTKNKFYNASNSDTPSVIKSQINKECKATENTPTIYQSPPFWKKDICFLEIPTFQLPKCYLITNYTRASVYLIAVDEKKLTCEQSGRKGDLNPVWNQYLVEPQKQQYLINQKSEIKNIRFTNLTRKQNYCIFVSMWETYPICEAGDTSHEDECYFFPKASFSCPRPVNTPNSQYSLILIPSCFLVLIVCLVLLVTIKRKTKLDLSSSLVSLLPTVDPNDTKDKHCKLYVLYYPNYEVTNADIKQITGKNGSLIENLNNICDSDKNVTIIDIVDKIGLDEIQDTSGIELDLCNGQAKCILILTPSAKKLFDHIASGGKNPNPLDEDLLDGSMRNVVMPLFKYILNIQNININMYQTIGCVRFDRNHRNAGDEININTLVRMSLPSDGKELAEWAIHSS